MAIKKLQSNYTTHEQSKRLLELGLPADSADCAYRGIYMPITILPPNVLYRTHEKEIHDLETKRDKQEGRFQTCEPCWSVGRLIEILLLCHIYDEAGIIFDKPLYEVSNCTNIEWCIRVLESSIQCKHIDFSKLEK